jgi:hypothetical protein
MGTYRSPDIVKSKTAEALAKTTEQITSAAAQYVVGVENRKKLRQLEENKINEDLYGVNKGISDIPKADDIGLDESMRAQLKGRMDELYRLGKEVAKGGSNEEYLKYKAETESLVQGIPDEIKSINYYAKMLDEGLSNGKFLEGTTDPNFVEFLMKWNEDGGSGVTTEFINGKMVLKKNGTIVNTSNLLRDANKGGGINFVENPMEELKTIFEGAVDYEEYKRLDTVVKQNGGTVTKEVEANYEKANQIARDYFDNVNIVAGSENDPLRDELNQNNWDYFIAGGDPNKGVYDRTDPKQVKQLREAVVNSMMSKFGKEDVILKQKSKSPASKSGSGKNIVDKNLFNKKELKQYNEIYAKANSVLASKVNTGKPYEYELKKLAKIAGEITRIKDNFKASTNENGDWVLLQNPGKDDEQEVVVNVNDRNDIIDFINTLSENPLDLYKSAPENNQTGVGTDPLGLNP